MKTNPRLNLTRNLRRGLSAAGAVVAVAVVGSTAPAAAGVLTGLTYVSSSPATETSGPTALPSATAKTIRYTYGPDGRLTRL